MKTLESAKQRFNQLKKKFQFISKSSKYIYNQDNKQKNSGSKTSRCSETHSKDVDSHDLTQRKHKRQISFNFYDKKQSPQPKINSLNNSVQQQWISLQQKQKTLKQINILLNKKSQLLNDIQVKFSPSSSRLLKQNQKNRLISVKYQNNIKAPNLKQIRKEARKKIGGTVIKWK